MMRLIVMCCFLWAGMAHAQSFSIEGVWLAAKKQDVAIEIRRCADTLCGEIVWIDERLQREHPEICGVSVLSGFSQNAKTPEKWESGTIYRATKDQYVRARLHQSAADAITLRGYIGAPILGKTYMFKKVNAADYPACDGAR